MRMETFEASQICNAIQSVHFGELGDSPVPFLVGFRYKVPADAFPQDTVFQLQILGFEDVALEGATGYWLCEIANNQGCLQKPPDGLTSRVDPCPEEWMYVECGGTMCTGCTNVMIRFFLNNAGNGPATVYVDDVSLAFVEE